MKISVVIITRNRWSDLKDTIDGFLKQTYKNFEIVVIDNASDDGTRHNMPKFFPDIKYTWLPENFDTRTINIAVAQTDGEIIWRTDDDSHPESEFAFEKVVDIFSKFKNIHIIATSDIEVRRGNMFWNWYGKDVDIVNVPEEGYPCNTFIGNGAAIRREVFDKIGGFWEFGFEELDFSTRAIINGFTIRYFPNIKTLHFNSPGDRVAAQRWIKLSKQYLRYQCRYFSIPRSIGRAAQIFMYQMIIGIATGISPKYLIEGAFCMIYYGIYALNNERIPAPKHKIHEITLGKSLFKSQMNYFKDLLKSKLKKKK